MKEIIDSQKTRQVQPKDFSFLSEADKEIVASIEKTIRVIYGYDNEQKPIILSGLVFDVSQQKVSKGEILYKGCLYGLENDARTNYAWVSNFKSGLNMITTESESDIYIRLKQIDIEPSPVYDVDRIKSIYCHKKNIAEIKLYAILDTDINLNNCYRVEELPSMQTIREMQKLTNLALKKLSDRVEALENGNNINISGLSIAGE